MLLLLEKYLIFFLKKIHKLALRFRFMALVCSIHFIIIFVNDGGQEAIYEFYTPIYMRISDTFIDDNVCVAKKYYANNTLLGNIMD